MTTVAQMLNAAIDACMQENTIIDLGAQNEPNKVARLVAHLPAKLIDVWKNQLNKTDLTVTSIFCHNKPKVRYTANPLFTDKAHPNPELADLLILVSAPDKSGTMIEHGILLQAKLGKNKYFSVNKDSKTGNPWVQRYMYANWPTFTMSPISSIAFGIGPGATPADEWTRYACIEKTAMVDVWNVEEFAAAKFLIPNNEIKKLSGAKFNATESLGSTIVDMISQKKGRSTSGADDWCKLVDCLKQWALDEAVLGNTPSGVSAAVGKIPTHSVSATAFLSSFMPLWNPVHPFPFLSYYRPFPTSQHPTQPYWHLISYIDGDTIRSDHGRGTPSDDLLNFKRGGFGIIQISVGERLENTDLP